VGNLKGLSYLGGIPDERWILSMNSNSLRPWQPTGFGLRVAGRYKYILFDDIEYLYDLHNDPEEEINLIVDIDKVSDPLYKSIQSYIAKTKNARDEYVKLFPGTLNYERRSVRTFNGKDLSTLTGITKEGSNSLHSTEKGGFLSYGPYIKLSTGAYELKVNYTLRGDDFTSSTYDIGFLEKGKWNVIKSGSHSLGVNETTSIPFAVKSEHQNKSIEFVHKFNGKGSMEIMQLKLELQ
jgi:hypothetical protein